MGLTELSDYATLIRPTMFCYDYATLVLCLAMTLLCLAMFTAMSCYVFAMFRYNFTSYGLCHRAPSCSGLNWCVNFTTSPSLTIDSRVLIF